MSAYKRLYNSDIVSTPYLANKNWSISVCDLDSYGIRVYNGVKTMSCFVEWETKRYKVTVNK